MSPTEIESILRKASSTPDIRQDAWVLMLSRSTPPSTKGHVLWSLRTARINNIRKESGEGRTDRRQVPKEDLEPWDHREPAPGHRVDLQDQWDLLVSTEPRIAELGVDHIDKRGRLKVATLTEALGTTRGRLNYRLALLRTSWRTTQC